MLMQLYVRFGIAQISLSTTTDINFDILCICYDYITYDEKLASPHFC